MIWTIASLRRRFVARWLPSREGLLALLVPVAAAVAWTWPLPARLATHLRDRYDCAAIAWTLAWVQDALVSHPGRLFDSNCFAPSRDALAFSEPLIGYAIAGLPLRWAGANPVAVRNIFFLAGLAYRLGGHEAGPRSRRAVRSGVAGRLLGFDDRPLGTPAERFLPPGTWRQVTDVRKAASDPIGRVASASLEVEGGGRVWAEASLFDSANPGGRTQPAIRLASGK